MASASQIVCSTTPMTIQTRNASGIQRSKRRLLHPAGLHRISPHQAAPHPIKLHQTSLRQAAPSRTSLWFEMLALSTLQSHKSAYPARLLLARTPSGSSMLQNCCSNTTNLLIFMQIWLAGSSAWSTPHCKSGRATLRPQYQ